MTMTNEARLGRLQIGAFEFLAVLLFLRVAVMFAHYIAPIGADGAAYGK